jgi:hypothetical protein
MDDAVVNDLMRPVVELAYTVRVAPASLYPDYADVLAGGFVMFGDELRFTSDAGKHGPIFGSLLPITSGKRTTSKSTPILNSTTPRGGFK